MGWSKIHPPSPFAAHRRAGEVDRPLLLLCEDIAGDAIVDAGRLIA
jgi:hypothetical protein